MSIHRTKSTFGKFALAERYSLDFNTLQWFKRGLEGIWGDTSTIRIDWLDFEVFIVRVLGSSEITDSQRVLIIKLGVDAFTKRGYFTSER
jgi:hypothetical protein